MTSKCLKLKWNGEWFYGKLWSIFNVISLKCQSLGGEKYLLVYLFFYIVLEKRTQETEKNRTFCFYTVYCHKQKLSTNRGAEITRLL